MVRTQICLTRAENDAAKREARRPGISSAELLRHSLRSVLPVDLRHARAGRRPLGR